MCSSSISRPHAFDDFVGFAVAWPVHSIDLVNLVVEARSRRWCDYVHADGLEPMRQVRGQPSRRVEVSESVDVIVDSHSQLAPPVLGGTEGLVSLPGGDKLIVDPLETLQGTGELGACLL